MPWSRAGTVAVTHGSPTVTGINTGFAANARVGDAFIGPDGRQYELGNVASDTVISIIPAYLGPSADGAAYSIMPVQGYQKGLADQVRDWVNVYGQKMAELGTTGNYEVLPVAKGGTGAASPVDARSGLGLGSVSVENVVPVAKGGTGGATPAAARAGLELTAAATTPIGTANGNLMPVGAFGLGASSAPVTAFSNVVGFSNHSGTASEAPVTGAGGTRITQNVGGNLFNELTITASSVNAPVLAYRQFNSAGSPGPWNIVYTNQNTTRAQDGTLKAI